LKGRWMIGLNSDISFNLCFFADSRLIMPRPFARGGGGYLVPHPCYDTDGAIQSRALITACRAPLSNADKEATLHFSSRLKQRNFFPPLSTNFFFSPSFTKPLLASLPHISIYIFVEFGVLFFPFEYLIPFIAYWCFFFLDFTMLVVLRLVL